MLFSRVLHGRSGARTGSAESSASSGVSIMNDDIFKGQWKQLKGEIRKRWNLLTDDDVEAVGGEMEKLEGSCRSDTVGKRSGSRERSPNWRRRGAGDAVSSPASGLAARGRIDPGLLGWGHVAAPPTPPSDPTFLARHHHAGNSQKTTATSSRDRIRACASCSSFSGGARFHPRLPRPALRGRASPFSGRRGSPRVISTTRSAVRSAARWRSSASR